MQGGCLCENAPGLRVQFSNMEISAAVAPRPQMLVAATGDWTKTTMELEGPGIRSAYRALGATQYVDYVLHDYVHNYNQATRESVYGFFNKWLLTDSPNTLEKEFPYAKEPDDKLLFLAGGKVPESAVNREDLIKYLKRQTHEALIDGKPSDEKSLKKYQKRTRLAWERTLQVPIAPAKLLTEKLGQAAVGDLAVTRLALGLDGLGNRIPVVQFAPEGGAKNWAIVVHPKGSGALLGPKGAPTGLAKALLEQGVGVLAPDLYQTGALANIDVAAKRDLTRNYFTVYNRTDLQERVLDLLAVTRHARRLGDKVILAGVDRAGLWVQSASPMADATIADCGQFSMDDETMVAPDLFYPGFYRLGGFEGIGLTGGATPKFLHNTGSQFSTTHMSDVYQAVGAGDRLRVAEAAASDADLAKWAAKL